NRARGLAAFAGELRVARGEIWPPRRSMRVLEREEAVALTARREGLQIGDGAVIVLEPAHGVVPNAARDAEALSMRRRAEQTRQQRPAHPFHPHATHRSLARSRPFRLVSF